MIRAKDPDWVRRCLIRSSQLGCSAGTPPWPVASLVGDRPAGGPGCLEEGGGVGPSPPFTCRWHSHGCGQSLSVPSGTSVLEGAGALRVEVPWVDNPLPHAVGEPSGGSLLYDLE